MKKYHRLKKDRLERLERLKLSKKKSGKHEYSDSVAQKTNWDLMNESTSNFKSKTFVKTSSFLYHYQISLMLKLFIIIISSIALIAVVSGVIMMLNSDKDGLITFVIGLVIVIIGYKNSREFNESIHFNKLNKTVVIKKNSSTFFELNKFKILTISFNDIHALQLLSERIKSKDVDYTDYQLNIVLKDASRHNLNNDPNSRRIFDTAKTLAELIDVPIWNTA